MKLVIYNCCKECIESTLQYFLTLHKKSSTDYNPQLSVIKHCCVIQSIIVVIVVCILTDLIFVEDL